MMDPKLQKLNASGYFYTTSITEAMELAGLLPGKIKCHRLSPQENEGARSHTLSKEFGLGEFPFHSDGVNQPDPPRYIQLNFKGPDASFVHFSLIDMTVFCEEEFWEEAIFSVRSGSKRFMLPCIFKKTSGKFFKYNPMIMTPLNNKAKEMVIEMRNFQNSIEQMICFQPQENSHIFIDNYRMLHSRGKVGKESLDRRWVERTWFYDN